MSEHGSRLAGSRLGSELDAQMAEKSERILVEKVQRSISILSSLLPVTVRPPVRPSVYR